VIATDGKNFRFAHPCPQPDQNEWVELAVLVSFSSLKERISLVRCEIDHSTIAFLELADSRRGAYPAPLRDLAQKM
jgi:hypothetical protein